jgi:hypothetical protein
MEEVLLTRTSTYPGTTVYEVARYASLHTLRSGALYFAHVRNFQARPLMI